MVVWPVAALVLLFCLLAAWQKRIERRQRDETVERIREARSLGADRPVGQFPQIEPLLCIGCSSCIRACPESGVLDLVNGIAHVVQASRCIGHGLCEQACPVGALTVGLGDVSARPDIPLISGEFETSVPGVYIAGELGGLALIQNAVEQGKRVVETIAAKAKRGETPAGCVDVLIVGAGPAGLAATLQAIEAGLSYVTIDQGTVGGTLRKYPRRKLVMTQPVQLPLGERFRRHEYRKEELIEQWEQIMARHGVAVREGVRLTGLRRGPVFEALTSNGPIRSRFVVLALGRRGTPRTIGVPGEERETVLYQLLDAATYTGTRTLVVGGGDSAIEAATALADQRGNRVTLSYRKEAFFRIKARNRERIDDYAAQGRVTVHFSSRVEAIESDSVRLSNTAGQLIEIENDYTFIFAGGEPPYPVLKDIGVQFGGSDAQ